MNVTLAELLENLKPGLLWVSRDGLVRYANADAGARTGLTAGRRLFDPDMTRAVAATVAEKATREISAMGVFSGNGSGTRQLSCRVLPGMGADDAFVLIKPDADQEQGAGLHNLLQAIRAEVCDPLRKARQALGKGPEAPEELGESLGELLTVLDRLVELSTLWSSSSLVTNDRIEVWPLLQKAWGRVEPLAKQRGVSVRFLAQSEAASLATLYGSEHWLSRVFEECLEAAVRGLRKDGAMEIEHRQLGPRALLIFRDSGVFADPGARTAGIAMPESEKPAKPANGDKRAAPSAKDQIGLKLCQHIVALHGGQLGEETVDGLRNFLIELPTGAPHRNDDQQAMDVAQAQQYAKDLAALMSRSRRQPQLAKQG